MHTPTLRGPDSCITHVRNNLRSYFIGTSAVKWSPDQEAFGAGSEQSTRGASRSESGDDLRPVWRPANQPSRTAESSMISALTLLRTPLRERSAHRAGIRRPSRVWVVWIPSRPLRPLLLPDHGQGHGEVRNQIVASL
jgi:hypothetical protein